MVVRGNLNVLKICHVMGTKLGCMVTRGTPYTLQRFPKLYQVNLGRTGVSFHRWGTQYSETEVTCLKLMTGKNSNNGFRLRLFSTHMCQVLGKVLYVYYVI